MQNLPNQVATNKIKKCVNICFPFLEGDRNHRGEQLTERWPFLNHAKPIVVMHPKSQPATKDERPKVTKAKPQRRRSRTKTKALAAAAKTTTTTTTTTTSKADAVVHTV